MSHGTKTVKRQLTQEVILDPQRRVRELSEIGSSVRVNKAFPVKSYFRSGSEMERQARMYYAEGQLDKAFILYNKFVTLFLEKLPKQYTDYNKPEYKTERAKIKKLVKEAFPRAEQLKQRLLTQYEEEKETLEAKLAQEAENQRREEEERRTAQQRLKEERELQARAEAERREREEAERVSAFLAASDSSTSTSQPANSNQPSLSPQATQGYETLPETAGQQSQWEEVATGVGGGELVANMSSLTIEDTPTTHTDTPGRSLTATNAELAQVLPPAYEGPSAPRQEIQTPQTPTLGGNLAAPPLSSVRTYHSIFSGPAQAPPPNYSHHPPATNPFYHSAGGQGVQFSPPAPSDLGGQYQPQQYALQVAPGQGYQHNPVPGGPYVTQYSNASSSSWGSVELPAPSYHMSPDATYPAQTIREEEEEEEEESSPQVPSVDRSTKPAYSALSTSIGGGYRMLYVPEGISRRFEEAASSNTRQNIETCGILAGKLSRNQLHVTHIILPKQRGGPDSCETLSEEELFDIQDQHDLITLGWIHTHPSQTAFMSSVDLHTHCSYQIMLDEAIAIVCAPRYSQVGVYMLTEPYGLDYITHCEEEGFHTHPKHPPLYEECSHVIFSQSPVELVDLR